VKSLGYSERRICRALGISRNSVRYEPQPRPDEAALTSSIVRLAGQYGRYGYRRIHAVLRSQGWDVSHGRVMRIWQREGLKIPSNIIKSVNYYKKTVLSMLFCDRGCGKRGGNQKEISPKALKI